MNKHASFSIDSFFGLFHSQFESIEQNIIKQNIFLYFSFCEIFERKASFTPGNFVFRKKKSIFGDFKLVKYLKRT